MDILDQLEAKIKTAVEKIRNLEARVKELENEKHQHDEKLQSLLLELEEVEGPQNGSGDSAQADSFQDQSPMY